MYQPVVIIGAPRSGTNMLRDMLVELPGVGTWPCDEINYIWRHGNLSYLSDEFTPDMATEKVKGYIRKQINNFAKEYALNLVVEKTCANSLRVAFVEKVLPDAKYIFIVRDGLDVVGSALERWGASLDMMYVLKKAKYVPKLDLPYYALRYLFNHLYRITSKEKNLAFWGPAMDDVDELLKKYSLTEVCALQWKKCVDNSERDFSNILSDRMIRVKYEEFVKQPVSEFEKIVDFLGQEVPEPVRAYLEEKVRSSSVGKGRAALGADGVRGLRPLIADTLDKYGYE